MPAGIEPQDVLDILTDVEVLTSLVTFQSFSAGTWVDVPGWVDLGAMITTDPDRDDVDYVALIPSAETPGLPALNTAMIATVTTNPRMAPGPYSVKRIDDKGGQGLMWEVELRIKEGGRYG